MPGYDGTGPRGMGPITGGDRGMCTIYGGFFGKRSFRRSIGTAGGRGFRNRFWATGMPGWMRGDQLGPWVSPFIESPSKEQEMEYLKGQAASLKTELEAIQSRLGTLGAK